MGKFNVDGVVIDLSEETIQEVITLYSENKIVVEGVLDYVIETKLTLDRDSFYSLVNAVYSLGMPFGDCYRGIVYSQSNKDLFRYWREPYSVDIDKAAAVLVEEYAGKGLVTRREMMNTIHVGYKTCGKVVDLLIENGDAEFVAGKGYHIFKTARKETAVNGSDVLVDDSDIMDETDRFPLDSIFDAVVEMVAPQKGIVSGNLEAALEFKKALKAFYDASK